MVDSILRLYASGVPEPSIIRSTGPGMFSDAVKAFVRTRYGAVFGEGQLSIKNLRAKPVHVGDVLVLTTKAFAGDGWDESSERLVRHSFAGTWKTKQPCKNTKVTVVECVNVCCLFVFCVCSHV